MHLSSLWNKNKNVFFSEDSYNQNSSQITKMNIRFYTSFNYIMIALVSMLFVSTYFTPYALELRYVYVVFLILSLIEVILLNRGITNSPKMSKYTIYYGILKTYLFGYLSSVVFNRVDYAITFYIFMILTPVSFVIKPKLMLSIQSAASVIFCISTLLMKPFDIAIGDVLACIVFFVIALVIAGQINSLRVNNLCLIAEEQKQNKTLEDQKDLLDVSLEIATLCNLPEADFRVNMDQIIEKVRTIYNAARAYVFEFDWPNNSMSNTYESIGEGVTNEKDNLQDLPIEMVAYWIPRFREGKEVFIEDLEEIKKDPTRKEEYDILAPQGIKTLAVLPIRRNGHLYGYIGVDNPTIRIEEHQFIMNVALLLSQEFYALDQQNKLFELSMTDSLTGLNNRHSYDVNLERMNQEQTKSVGALFCDVNGLKQVNDKYGHKKGDDYILEAANVLQQHFSKEKIFRISGDEFVVICENIEEQSFDALINQLKEDVQKQHNSILAIGHVWKSTTTGEQMIAEAEISMYQAKSNFYIQHPERSRRQR